MKKVSGLVRCLPYQLAHRYTENYVKLSSFWKNNL